MSCGIYRILNLKTGRCYVGSSLYIEERWNGGKKCHLALLRNGKHHSWKLQASWNKHGEAAFKHEILQECSSDLLLYLEAFWMTKLNAVENGYNVLSLTLEDQRVKRSFRHSEETLAKMRNRVKSDEHQRKIAEANRGKKRSIEACLNMSNAKRPPATLDQRRKLSEAAKLQWQRKKQTESERGAI